MARHPRSIQGGLVYHVLNRASARSQIFLKPEDYAAFERTLEQARQRIPMRILTYILMPDHFHLALWPRRGQEKALSDFMHWLQVTHTQRWHAHYHTSGTGHLYQGRFKAFPVQGGPCVRRICRYVESNPSRAKLCRRAEQWQWSGLWRRLHGTVEERGMLADWPDDAAMAMSRWLPWVNAGETPQAMAAVAESLRRERPFGEASWVQTVARRLGLEHTIRPRGRTKKAENDS